jgi:hypothetical protein
LTATFHSRMVQGAACTRTISRIEGQPRVKGSIE